MTDSDTGSGAGQPEVDGVWSAHAFHILAGSAASAILVATVVYMWVEGWGWIDSFYFSVVAVTTVGFGDFAPETDLGKLFTVLYIVVGLSLVTAYLNERFKRHGAARAERWKEKRKPDE